jgi:hypothetical protein
MGTYVGREQAIVQLRTVLAGSTGRPGRVHIQSIEGPGGVGKTALFDHVLATTPLVDRKYLTMRVAGAPEYQVDPFQVVQGLVASSRAPAGVRLPLRQQFSYTDEVNAVYEGLLGRAKTELAQQLPNVPVDAVMAIIKLAVATGKRINEFSPASKKYLDCRKIEQSIPQIEEALKELKPFVDEAPGVLDKLGLGKQAALRNALRRNPLSALSNAVETDLSNLLSGYRKKDWRRPTRTKVDGIDRLLLVIDDYESLAEVLGEFLVNHLVDGLKHCDFETVLVILGRDQLALTHPGWIQHHYLEMLPSISLQPLTRVEMDELATAYKVTESSQRDRAWRDTQGFPLLVHLWIEEAREGDGGGGPSVGLLKKFHDRTTRWMNDEQKHWLDHVLFLTRVNVRSMTAMLGTEAEARQALHWFEGEGSVRDHRDRAFRVIEYVRSRLADYLQVIDPDRYDTLREAGERISAGESTKDVGTGGGSPSVRRRNEALGG